MSGYGPYFADDEASSEDKISRFGSVNTAGNEGTKTSENQDDSKSNTTSAFSSFRTNEDDASFASAKISDQADHRFQKQESAGKPTNQQPGSASKAGTESSGVSCEDLVIVLEESKFLKVLEDVVKELVEKLVTEKISDKGSARSSHHLSANRAKGSNTAEIKRTFEKRVKDFTDTQQVGFESDQPKRTPRDLDDENVTSQSSQPRNSKSPSQPAQGKAAQAKPQVNNVPSIKVTSSSQRGTSTGSKAKSASSRKGGAESNVPQEPKQIIDRVCYFKSKSAARKNSKRDKGSHYGDETCKIICRSYMRPHPDDVKEQNLKIANSLFSATFSLFMRKLRKQDTLASKIGIALCGPRQCFEECNSQDRMEIVRIESPENNDQNRGQSRSTSRSGSVFPKLSSGRSSKRSGGSQQSSVCFKHCVDASTNVRSRFTVLPKL